jgi:hypothetical protein
VDSRLEHHLARIADALERMVSVDEELLKGTIAQEALRKVERSEDLSAQTEKTEKTETTTRTRMGERHAED